MDPLHSIDPALLEKVQQPIGNASGMPNEAYTSEQAFRFERDHVMACSWVALDFMSRLPEVGYLKPIDFMGMPLLVINNDGQFDVFHNVCRHRGMILVDQAGKTPPAIACPYHCWTYKPDGSLIATPNIGGVGQPNIAGFDKAEHGLKRIRTHQWFGMLWVNLDGNAPEFNDYADPLIKRWSEFLGDEGWKEKRTGIDGAQLGISLACNWKLAVENYCEAYHLPMIHPDLNRYSPLKVHETIIVGSGFSGQLTHAYTLAETAGITLPQFSHWPEGKIKTGEYLSFYPNVLLGIQADHGFAIILTPTSASTTEEQVEIFYIDDGAENSDYQASRAAVLESWKVVFSEDIRPVEGMQKGRESGGFDGGVFSPALDQATHHFHQWVARHYQRTEPCPLAAKQRQIFQWVNRFTRFTNFKMQFRASRASTADRANSLPLLNRRALFN